MTHQTFIVRAASYGSCRRIFPGSIQQMTKHHTFIVCVAFIAPASTFFQGKVARNDNTPYIYRLCCFLLRSEASFPKLILSKNETLYIYCLHVAFYMPFPGQYYYKSRNIIHLLFVLLFRMAAGVFVLLINISTMKNVTYVL